MKGLLNQWRLLRTLLVGLSFMLCAALTGCQIEQGGQSLPSPYYMQDDVQYYPPGPEFKLAREAAAMKAFSQDSSQQAVRR